MKKILDKIFKRDPQNPSAVSKYLGTINIKVLAIIFGAGLLILSLLFAIVITAIYFATKTETNVPSVVAKQPPPPPTGVNINSHIMFTAASTHIMHHPAAHAFDGNKNSAWNSIGKSDRAPWISMEFDVSMKVYGIKLATGWDKMSKKNVDLFMTNKQIKRVMIQFDDGKQVVREVDKGKRYLKIKGLHVNAKKIKISVLEMWAGTKYKDLPISTIELMGVDKESKDVDSICICKHKQTTDINLDCKTSDLKGYENIKLGVAAVRSAYDAAESDPGRSKELAKEAIEYYKCALASNPHSSRVNGDISWAYQLAGDYVKALSHQRSVQRSYDDVTQGASWHLTAKIYCDIGDVAAARNATIKSLKNREYIPYNQVKKYSAYKKQIEETCSAELYN